MFSRNFISIQQSGSALKQKANKIPMVLGGHSRKIIVRGQEYRWVASGKQYRCSCRECRQLTLAIEKRLHHSRQAGKGRKSHSAHPSRRRSILLTLKIGSQLPYLGSCPTFEDIVEHMLPRTPQLLCGFIRIRFENSQSIPSLRLLAIDAIFSVYTAMEALKLSGTVGPAELLFL